MPDSAKPELTFLEVAHLQHAGIDVSSYTGLPVETIRVLHSDILVEELSYGIPTVPLLQEPHVEELLISMSLIFQSKTIDPQQKWHAQRFIQLRMTERDADVKFTKTIKTIIKDFKQKACKTDQQDFMELDEAVLVADCAQLVGPFRRYASFPNPSLQKQYENIYDNYCFDLLFILGCKSILEPSYEEEWKNLHGQVLTIVEEITRFATTPPKKAKKRRR